MFWLFVCGCDEWEMIATQVDIPPGQAPGKYRVLQGEYLKDVKVSNTDATHIRGTV